MNKTDFTASMKLSAAMASCIEYMSGLTQQLQVMHNTIRANTSAAFNNAQIKDNHPAQPQQRYGNQSYFPGYIPLPAMGTIDLHDTVTQNELDGIMDKLSMISDILSKKQPQENEKVKGPCFGPDVEMTRGQINEKMKLTRNITVGSLKNSMGVLNNSPVAFVEAFDEPGSLYYYTGSGDNTLHRVKVIELGKPEPVVVRPILGAPTRMFGQSIAEGFDLARPKMVNSIQMSRGALDKRCESVQKIAVEAIWKFRGTENNMPAYVFEEGVGSAQKVFYYSGKLENTLAPIVFSNEKGSQTEMFLGIRVDDQEPLKIDAHGYNNWPAGAIVINEGSGFPSAVLDGMIVSVTSSPSDLYLYSKETQTFRRVKLVPSAIVNFDQSQTIELTTKGFNALVETHGTYTTKDSCVVKQHELDGPKVLISEKNRDKVYFYDNDGSGVAKLVVLTDLGADVPATAKSGQVSGLGFVQVVTDLQKLDVKPGHTCVMKVLHGDAHRDRFYIFNHNTKEWELLPKGREEEFKSVDKIAEAFSSAAKVAAEEALVQAGRQRQKEPTTEKKAVASKRTTSRKVAPKPPVK